MTKNELSDAAQGMGEQLSGKLRWVAYALNDVLIGQGPDLSACEIEDPKHIGAYRDAHAAWLSLLIKKEA